jgi:hypothetical protein
VGSRNLRYTIIFVVVIALTVGAGQGMSTTRGFTFQRSIGGDGSGGEYTQKGGRMGHGDVEAAGEVEGSGESDGKKLL